MNCCVYFENATNFSKQYNHPIVGLLETVRRSKPQFPSRNLELPNLHQRPSVKRKQDANKLMLNILTHL